jgi:cytolysin (calcineurin-like family phosphatase)
VHACLMLYSSGWNVGCASVGGRNQLVTNYRDLSMAVEKGSTQVRGSFPTAAVVAVVSQGGCAVCC